MCSPLALAGVQATGSLVQGYAGMQAGKAQQSLADAQALAEQDAALAEAEQLRRRGRSAQGAARAALAGAGVSVDSTTALDITQDIGQRAEQDALMTILSGERRGRQLRADGAIAAARGRGAFASSVLTAGAQIGQGWYAPAPKAYAGGMTGFYGGTGRSGD